VILSLALNTFWAYKYSFLHKPIVKAYVMCLIKPFLIKGKQSGLVGNVFPRETSFIIHANKMNALKTGSLKPSD